MFKCIRIFLCALLSWISWEILGAGALSSARPLSDPPNQWSAFCVSALQPVINHLRKEQEDCGNCYGKLGETQAKLLRIELY